MPPQNNKKENPQPVFLNEEGLSPAKKEKMPSYDPSLKTLRTFKGDLEEVVNKKNESVVSIVTAEVKQQEKEIVKKESNPNFVSEKDFFAPRVNVINKNSLAFLISGVLILLGIFTFVFIYRNKPNEEKISKVTSVISYSKLKSVNLANLKQEDIVGVIKSEESSFKDKDLSVLFIRFLNNNQFLTGQSFFKALFPTMPNEISRLVNDYMVGVLYFGSNKVFIALNFEDYNRVYASMIRWENLMKKDLSSLYNPDINSYSFKDEVFKNNDLRVVKNIENKTLVVYGFIDKSILIIAPDEESFMILKDKYINSKLVR